MISTWLVIDYHKVSALILARIWLIDQIMWWKSSLSASLMSSVSGLTSTSWVIAVSSDDGENDGGVGTTHTANPQWTRDGMEGSGMDMMREIKVKSKGEGGETRRWVV